MNALYVGMACGVAWGFIQFLNECDKTRKRYGNDKKL